LFILIESRDSKVSVVGCRTRGRFPAGTRDLSPTRSDRVWGAKFSHPVGAGGTFPLGEEAGA